MPDNRSNVTHEYCDQDEQQMIFGTDHDDIPDVTLGYRNDLFNGTLPARVSYETLRRYLVITGNSGYGMEAECVNILSQIAHNGEGLCFIDFRGDAAESILQRIPQERLDDVVYIGHTPQQHDIQGFDIYEGKDDDNVDAEQIASTVCETILACRPEIDTPPAIVERLIKMGIQKGAPDELSYTTLGENIREQESPTDEVVANLARLEQHGPTPFESIDGFHSDHTCERFFTPESNPVSIYDIVTDEQILVVDLSETSDQNIQTGVAIGVLAKIYEAAMHTVDSRSEQPFFVAGTGFHQLAESDTIQRVVPKAHSYNLSLILTLQYIGQVSQTNSEIPASFQNLLCYNQGTIQAANKLVPLLGIDSRDDLRTLPRYHAFAAVDTKHSYGTEQIQTFPLTQPERESTSSLREVDDSKKE